jgi:hypothetical protein
MNVKARLAQALMEANAPAVMIDDATRGRYADFESDSATPIMDLVRDCRRLGLNEIATRAMDGEFDGE